MKVLPAKRSLGVDTHCVPPKLNLANEIKIGDTVQVFLNVPDSKINDSVTESCWINVEHVYSDRILGTVLTEMNHTGLHGIGYFDFISFSKCFVHHVAVGAMTDEYQKTLHNRQVIEFKNSQPTPTLHFIASK